MKVVLSMVMMTAFENKRFSSLPWVATLSMQALVGRKKNVSRVRCVELGYPPQPLANGFFWRIRSHQDLIETVLQE
jgi:hypothetical protein